MVVLTLTPVNMSRFFVAFALAMGLLLSCSHKDKKVLPPVAARDTTVTAAVSYSDLFLDSTTMEKFIAAQGYDDTIGNRLRDFYNKRNYQFAWFFKEGPA